MYQKTKYIIRFFALALIVYGGLELPSGLRGIWFSLQSFLYSSSNTFWEKLYFASMPLFFSLVSISAIRGGIGLLCKKKWGWILSRMVSFTIFIISCFGIINFAVLCYFFRNVPVPPIQEGSYVVSRSMIPTYITAVISLVFTIVFSRKSIKSCFFN